jgi:hypothetical protein
MNGIVLDGLGGTPPDILVLNEVRESVDSVMEYAIRNIEQ